jgi:hypothetical protein
MRSGYSPTRRPEPMGGVPKPWQRGTIEQGVSLVKESSYQKKIAASVRSNQYSGVFYICMTPSFDRVSPVCLPPCMFSLLRVFSLARMMDA